MNFFSGLADKCWTDFRNKNCFEHIFEIGIFNGIKCCLRGKSLKVLARVLRVYFCLICLIILVSHFFLMILFVYWLFALFS